jgi:hypothetical protein
VENKTAGECAIVHSIKNIKMRIAIKKTLTALVFATITVIGRCGPYPGACSGKFATIGNVVDDLCIWVWTTPV